MKVCHVISSIDKNSGGTTEYLRLLTSALSTKIKISVCSLNSKDPIKFNKRVYVYLKDKSFMQIGYSRGFSRNLLKTNCNIFHGNGLWQYPVYSMVKIALIRNIPYVISVHGMLEPWSLNQGKLKKQVALKIFQYKNLEKARCIHATSPMEVKNIRKLGVKNPIAMIPNGISIEEFIKELPVKTKNTKKILFLSRIHIKKGIENLINAWSLIDNNKKEGWEIEIIGNGDENYIKYLNKKIISKNLSDQIKIKKPVFGEEKMKLFREASLFVLPTFSENFGIVIAEALASYTPVITTKGTPWQDLNNNNCGWWIDIGIDPLKKALEEALCKSCNELFVMGQNGRVLVEEKFSMESVAKQMFELYNWILTKKNKPAFIDVL